MKYKISNRRLLEIMIHVFCWILFFGFPVIMTQNSNGTVNWNAFLRFSVVPFSLFAIFYLNYFVFIPYILFNGHKKRFIVANIIAIAVLSVGLRICSGLFFPPTVQTHEAVDRVRPPHFIFFARDIASLIFSAGLSVAIRLSIKWDEAERSKREAIKSKAEAELRNLRNQLNPHFLLNTLNNIYALTALDTEKAQKAIGELSKMLRYVLYNNQTYVPLCQEMDFIKNYISLMSIRLGNNVELNTVFNVKEDSRTQVVPLIFISLIENAFKHGVSPVGRSFINISISESDNMVTCCIENSYHPKNDTDKSGSGIGLQQVRQRLEIMYPGLYSWNTELSEDKKVYKTTLTIKPEMSNTIPSSGYETYLRNN